jgi:hypothetical protein
MSEITSERQDIVQGITDVIQRVYGDATQSALDHRAASEIWRHLTERGVIPPSLIAAIVESAGGEVIVPSRVILDPPDQLWLSEDGPWNGRKLQSGRSQKPTWAKSAASE